MEGVRFRLPGKGFIYTAISVAAAIAVLIVLLAVSTALAEPWAHIYPNYSKADISAVLSKKLLTDADYETLFYQTGLGRPAVDELRVRYFDFGERILRFQKNFFNNVGYICEKNSLVSREESLVDEYGNLTDGTELAPVHDGDILITKCSHTYGWRNGHCALVIDAAVGNTLESVVLGTDSTVQDINKWTNYPDFMLLRLKNAPPDLPDNVAKAAAKYLCGVPYRLTAGIFGPKIIFSDRTKVLHDAGTHDILINGEITGTHCSHLVWQAYMFYGYNVDSDRGLIVTPKDIANSPHLEIVQVYGVDPVNIWP